MRLQDWWFTTLMGTPLKLEPPLRGDIRTDVLIIGAGAAGLAAAMRLMDQGLDVTLIDRNICGGSSTGKSAGFLTPDSELELSQILRRYGPQGARDLWECAQWGVDRMVSVIRDHGIDADLQKQDCLFLGEGRSGPKEVDDEIAARRSMGYHVQGYTAAQLPSVVGATGFTGAVRYPNTYGVNGLRYAQAVKKILVDHGVHVYESTEAIGLKDHSVRTHLGSITANNIVFCADKLPRALTDHYWNYYYAQTFLAISEPLRDSEVRAMFPEEPFQCWDSHFIYAYWRLTGDKRILLGGGSLWTTYAKNDTWSERIIDRVIRRFREHWPSVAHVHFRQFWMGRIDMTRDLMPTVVREEKAPWTQYVLGCVGLPWATFCGDFAARHVLSDGAQEDRRFYRYFAEDRRFLVPLWAEELLGKRVSFVLNQFYAKYRQVDRAPGTPETPGPSA
ncbi:MAG TPA: FAD-dependent oxidoreductase [Thermoplasmata archaeon]|nr:FAD-dependent oxidoreductase [Thermoplasmata archaeon]